MTCLIISYLSGAGDQSVGVLIFTKPRSWAFSSSIISTNFGIEESCLAVDSEHHDIAFHEPDEALTFVGYGHGNPISEILKFFLWLVKVEKA